MKYTIDQLSFVVPAISIGFLVIITSINLYFKIRKRFPLTVNCWFCNENSRIPYVDFNRWTCKKCEQYNGFTEDGDYNCDIPAQRSSKLNKWRNSNAPSLNGSIISSRITSTNGLCEPCNRNQELKVQQLASFEPQNDAYFDEEIDEYRTKLEQAYRLCPRCERCLKRTLNRVKTNVLGSKLKQIGAKGLRAFDLSENSKTNKMAIYTKRYLFAKISLIALISISLIQLYVISNQISITKTKLDSVFSTSMAATILTILSYFSAAKIMISAMFDQLFNLPYILFVVTSCKLFIKYLYTFVNGDIWAIINTNVANLIELSGDEKESIVEFPTLMLNLSGCFMSTFLLFLTGLKVGPVLSLILWSLNMIVPSMTQDILTPQNALLFDFVQLSLTWTLAGLSILNIYKLNAKQIQSDAANSSFHRIDSDSNSDVSDSEESELETSLRSNSSIGGSQSKWDKTQLLNSTIASSATSIISDVNSLHKKSFAASTQSLCSLHATAKQNASFRSVRELSKCNPLDLGQQKLNQSAFIASSQNHLNRTHHIPTASQNYHDVDFASRCTSRNSLYDIPDDFESGITQLSISGIDNRPINYRKQTRIFGSSDRIRDSLQKSLLAPSRLNANDHHHANQSSWLAGGYWNNSTSPQKRCTSQISHSRMELDATKNGFEAFPMVSRTSSHSSGFESMRNSTHNNSYENSLCGDGDTDRTFLFCEPASQIDLVKPQPMRLDTAGLFGSIGGNGALNGENDQIASFRSISITPSVQPQRTLSNASTTNHWNQFSQQGQSLFTSQQQNHANNTVTLPYQRGALIKLNNTTNI